jgi:dimethylhistidine N-methyltransferase
MVVAPHRLDKGYIEEFARDVVTGLASTPKALPSKYFYDDVGSALFDAITVLPEYGLTRADERLLRRFAGQIPQRLDRPLRVAELGSGSGMKTAPILQAIAARRPFVNYHAIDVSASALHRCSQELARLRGVSVNTLHRSYLDGLQYVREQRSFSESLLVLFLGSTIGNFDRVQASVFLKEIRQVLVPGDALLLGADLVKPEHQLRRAYDDDAGVTAAFNLNLLCRINRELKGDFRIRNFRHQVRWLSRERRIEMHLESLSNQFVTIGLAGRVFAFQTGETIHTESSHKFELGELDSMAMEAGFKPDVQWVDNEWPFAEVLWIVPSGD